MDVHAVRHRTNEAQLVHLTSDAGEMLADLDSRYVRPDRQEFTSDFTRGVRLGIPEIDLAGATKQENKDA